MTTSALRAGALSCALLATTALTVPAMAQTAPPPRFEAVDENGVDLVSGLYAFSIVEGSIGSGDGAVSLTRNERYDYGFQDEWNGSLTQLSSTQMRVTFGARTENFTLSGSTWVPDNANGATLTQGSGTWSYLSADGITVVFGLAGIYSYGPCSMDSPPECMVVTSVARPNGTTFSVNWTLGEQCLAWDPETFECTVPVVKVRMAGVTSSTGYAFTLSYATNTLTHSSWNSRTGATFTNNVTAPPSNPTVTYNPISSTIFEITHTSGRTSRITRDSSGRIVGIRRPGSSSDDITVSWSAGGTVSSVTRDGVATSYARSVVGNTATTTVTNALSQQTVVVADLAKQRVTSVRDGLNRTTSYQYDANSRLTRVTQPEGNYVQFTNDSRGNVTQAQFVPKSGSGSPTLTTSASYPSTCPNVLTCNQPTSTTDARSNTTDYTYDGTHGGLLTVTAPTVSGGRPQTRVSYSLTNGEYRPTGISACSSGTAPSCVGTANEARTVIGYDSQGQVNSVQNRDGSGTLVATTTGTYDAYGNLLTVDGPLSGTADTTRLRYNAARQVVGVVGPDPDGGGSLKHRAVRTTYRADGLPIEVERGTVNSQSDVDWAAFASLEQVQTDYDANDRPTVQRLVGGSTTYALTQTGYDALGRPQCVAQRMNPAEFASLPSNACTLDTTGSHGADRIARTTWDAAGQVTLVQTGYGVTGVQADEVATAWTTNGAVSHVTDAEGNRTTYQYDGHDRLYRTYFPDPTTAGTSSTTDYEQLTRDANGNVTNFRNRGNQNIAFTYDALNRMTFKNLPSPDPDVTYTYDLLNRLTGASQAGGQALTFTYDALGRNLTQGGPLGTVSYEYDLSGRRTKLTYPGTGLFVNYDYLVTGEVTKIRENGATSGVGVLATYAYDNLGRRTTLTRGNTTSTTYGYDAVSRLSQLVQNPAGTTHDLTLTFTHNPAMQIATNTRSNDTYAWTNHYGVNRNYTADGLNRYTAAGSITPTYDNRGNLTSAGGPTYTYNSENMLISATGGVTLGFDPAMRLYQTSDGTTTTRMLYDGASLIAEYNGSNALQRRFVHGPGIDEPLVWYEGTGTADRRWLHADERGSVVAITSGTGAVTTVNSYDEYGIPGSTNGGRFQYTGQQWLPELGMYHYRARIYSPTLGRFLQTDPIGYGAGMNLYAYVGNDPVNFVDPSGLTPNHREEMKEIRCSGDCYQQTIYVTVFRCEGYCFRPDDLYRQDLMSRFLRNERTDTIGDRRTGNNECDPPSPNCAQVNGVPPEPPAPPPNAPTFILQPILLVASATDRDYCTIVGDNIGLSRRPVSSVCRSHDNCYGSSTNRSVCDRRFYDELLGVCATVRWDFMCRVDARAYYIGVRNLGERYYVGTGRND